MAKCLQNCVAVTVVAGVGEASWALARAGAAWPCVIDSVRGCDAGALGCAFSCWRHFETLKEYMEKENIGTAKLLSEAKYVEAIV
jgi:hypothetical protein